MLQTINYLIDLADLLPTKTSSAAYMEADRQIPTSISATAVSGYAAEDEDELTFPKGAKIDDIV
jgi:hypothetical protein